MSVFSGFVYLKLASTDKAFLPGFASAF